MLPHPLTNIRRNYQNELRFNGVYSRHNLPKKINGGTYVISLDDYSGICTHWIAYYLLWQFWSWTHS